MDRPSEIVPYTEEPNHDQMSNHAYPPQFHDIQPEMPPREVLNKIPINGVILKESTTAYCYNCNDYCETKVGKKVGCMIYTSSCFIFLFCPLLSPFLVPIPFCIPSCYETGHYCPKCKKIIASQKPDFKC